MQSLLEYINPWVRKAFIYFNNALLQHSAPSTPKALGPQGPEGPLGPLGTLGPNRALRARGTKYGTKKYGNDMVLVEQNWVVGWRCSAKPVLDEYFLFLNH